MSTGLCRQLAKLLLIASMLLFARPSEAQNYPSLNGADFNFTADIVLVVVAAAVVVTGVIVGIYFLTRTPRVNGCVVAGVGGLELLSEDGKTRYTLDGDATTLALFKLGEHVRVVGKKKKDPAGSPHLAAQKILKDLGTCSVPSAGTVLPGTP